MQKFQFAGELTCMAECPFYCRSEDGFAHVVKGNEHGSEPVAYPGILFDWGFNKFS